MTIYCDNCGRETPEHSLIATDDGMVCARCHREQGDLEEEGIEDSYEGRIWFQLQALEDELEEAPE
jgi:DNA-directed RNA polymerase subunit RPC12/RpoP